MLTTHVPGNVLPVLERIMKAQTTESEKTDTQVFSVYISIASVKENRVRFSAQLRRRSASAAYNALPCNIYSNQLLRATDMSSPSHLDDKHEQNFKTISHSPVQFRFKGIKFTKSSNALTFNHEWY